MVDQRVVEYVRKYHTQYPVEDLKKGLISKGFSESDVTEAIRLVELDDLSPGKDSQSSSVQTKPLENNKSTQSNNSSSFNTNSKSNNSDDRLKDTFIAMIIISLSFSLVTFVVNSLFSLSFSITGLLFTILFSAVGGLIGGVLFYYLFEPVSEFLKGIDFFRKFFKSLYDFFWKPFLIGIIISAIFSFFGALGLLFLGGVFTVFTLGFGAGIFIPIILLIVAGIVNLVLRFFMGKFIFRKVIDMYLDKHYKW